MDDVRREMEHRQRILGIYNKTRGAFDSKEEFDNYLEAVEDIIYKLTSNKDVAEVEQQVQDYVRQEAALAAANAVPEAGSSYVPSATGGGMQPAPMGQVQQDAQGSLLPLNASAGFSREQWQRMADASGWTQELATRRALHDALTTVFAF